MGTTVEHCLEALERTTSAAKSERMYNQEMVRERDSRAIYSLRIECQSRSDENKSGFNDDLELEINNLSHKGLYPL